MKRVVPLALLALVLPFEPMKPLWTGFSMEVSFLEIAAAALLGLAVLALLPSRPRGLPLGAAAGLFLLVCFASTLAADEPFSMPLKASLRVLAGVVAFVVTSAALERRRSFEILFAGFAAAGVVVSGIALTERLLWPEPLAFLDRFRTQAFEVGGVPRVSATFAYPNLLGGFLAAVLPFLLFFRESRPRLVALMSLGVFLAVLLTHSRGALLGAVVGTSIVWLFDRAKPYWLRLHLGFAVLLAVAVVTEPAFRWRTTSEGDDNWYQARIEPLKRSLTLGPGELTETSVTIENVGALTWANEGVNPIHLSYRWFERESADPAAVRPVAVEGERTRLDRPLEPGDRRTLQSIVRAPEREGSYLLVWDLVHEETTWFSDKVGLNAPVDVVVRSEDAREVSGGIAAHDKATDWSAVPRTWRPGRLELWTAALRLFRANPLLGVGPDNFRWRYGPAMGHERWDTRTYANSLYLETLADTGIAGFLALGWIVGSALLGLRSIDPLDGVSIALVAALAALLVHGLFDYLLEATPLYLTFWMILGAASARIRTELPRRSLGEDGGSS